MTTSEFLWIGPDRLLLNHWHDDRGTVVVAPVGPRRPLDPLALDAATAALTHQGIRRVLTTALDEADQQTFVAAGFTVHEELHLLRHELERIPKPPAHRLRRGHGGRDLIGAVEVDRAAFGPDAHLDVPGLRGARAATPASRFRVFGGHGRSWRRPDAYAVCGLSAGGGYVQRVAVAPDARRQGLGSALVVDGLRWFQRRRAGYAMVNTQVGNDAALALYVGTGFVPLPNHLAVLARDLGSRQ